MTPWHRGHSFDNLLNTLARLDLDKPANVEEIMKIVNFLSNVLDKLQILLKSYTKIVSVACPNSKE